VLYLIATPIGNLADITYRAIDTLKQCDYILCEDTRHSLTLLKHYSISKPLRSYHQFNEAQELESICRDLEQGQEIALITDAGTPGISDPGFRLIKACHEKNLAYTALPGACAVIQGLVLSAMDTEVFQFCGFLPKKSGQLKQQIIQMLEYSGSSIAYESPHRLLKTLKLFDEINPDREIAVARELTKRYEEVVKGKASEVLKSWESKAVKGEIVLIIQGKDEGKDSSESWEGLSLQEHVELLMKSYDISKKEAIKLVAKTRQINKRDLYQNLHQNTDDSD
jgi:16S rRNA (cytidine1402-2'-O)-methyltransferase